MITTELKGKQIVVKFSARINGKQTEWESAFPADEAAEGINTVMNNPEAVGCVIISTRLLDRYVFVTRE